MRAPFSWIGGKHFLIKYHLPLFPEHVTYVEPFGGAATLLFAKKPSKVEVYKKRTLNILKNRHKVYIVLCDI